MASRPNKPGGPPPDEEPGKVPPLPGEPEPPPPPDPNAPVEIAPCPGCQARLSVATTDLGVDVECPYCKTVYKAARADAAPAPSKGSRASHSRCLRRAPGE